MTDETLVTVQRQDSIGIIRLDRPKALNALSEAMNVALADAIRSLDADPAVAVIILQGNGRAFCSGADRAGLARMGEVDTATIAEALRAGEQLARSIVDARSIVICAVHGYCVGGGLSLVLCSDICIAAEGTIFFAPEVGHGLPYLWWSTAQMITSVGIHRTKFLSMTEQRFDAGHAHQIGLVSSIHPVAELEQAALDLARTLCSKPRAALLGQKRLANRVFKAMMAMTGDEITLALDCVGQTRRAAPSSTPGH